MSFYDSLNKLVVGVLLLLLFGDSAQGNELMFIIVAFVLGLVFQFVVRECTPFLNNIHCLIRCARNEVYRDLPNDNVKGKDDDGLMHEYLLAYYNVAKHGVLMNIPVLEATENFLRNIFMLTLLSTVFLPSVKETVEALLSFGGSVELERWYLIVFLITLAIIWFFTQKKIHELIWEGDRYLKELEKPENKFQFVSINTK